MIKDWKNNKKPNNELPPPFPVKKPGNELTIHIDLEKIGPILASWFINKSDAERQIILFNAYSSEKLRETGCSEEEIRSVEAKK